MGQMLINNDDWLFPVSNAGTSILQTEGLYLDRNIQVEIPLVKYNISGNNPSNYEVYTSASPENPRFIFESGWAEEMGGYLEGVKLSPQMAGEKVFFVEVPNGSTLEYIRFYFHVKSNGEVYVTESYDPV